MPRQNTLATILILPGCFMSHHVRGLCAQVISLSVSLWVFFFFSLCGGMIKYKPTVATSCEYSHFLFGAVD